MQDKQDTTLIQTTDCERGFGHLPLPHAAALDTRLTWAARGVLVWMLAALHAGQQLTEKQIRQQLGQEADAVLAQLSVTSS